MSYALFLCKQKKSNVIMQATDLSDGEDLNVSTVSRWIVIKFWTDIQGFLKMNPSIKHLNGLAV